MRDLSAAIGCVAKSARRLPEPGQIVSWQRHNGLVASAPYIALPEWFASESGLLLPGSVAPLRPAPGQRSPVAIRNRGPVAIKRNGPPTSLNNISVCFTENEAGLPASRVETIREHVAEVRFAPAMRRLARIAASAWALRHDQPAQLRLAEQVFAGHPALDSMREFVVQQEKAVLFSEQYALVVMRLLVEDAADDGLPEDNLSAFEIGHIQAALLGVTSIIDVMEDIQGSPLDDLDSTVAFFVRNGAYNRKAQPMGELVRARELYSRIANGERAKASPHFCPLDEWMSADYGYSGSEQLALGFALSAMTEVWANDERAGARSYIPPANVTDLLHQLHWEERREQALALLAGDRAYYAQRFAELGMNADRLAWETRPFMERPFLETGNGGLISLSPRAVSSWLTDGFYYRLLNAAQDRNISKRRKTSRRFTSFAGALLEEWCLDLATAAFSHGHHPGGGRVYGEQPYGNKGKSMTSDLAIHISTDLVLVEITASRLQAETVVSADASLAVDDLQRMVINKVKQLDGCIGALVKGTAEIPAEAPEVLMAGIERVWPIVVAGGHVSQNEFTWRWLKPKIADHLSQAKVQPLTVLDVEDFEALMGAVEHGHSLIRILEGKTTTTYHEYELAIYFGDDPSLGEHAGRSALIEECFERATTEARAYFEASPQETDQDAG